jgi:hypothetical protein
MVRGRPMPSFWADRTIPLTSYDARPALTSFADEVCATVARIFAYVGTVALFGILGVHLWTQYHAMRMADPAAKASWAAGWSVAGRSHPAFAVSQLDPPDISASYTILRHPEGGRKDILRWTNVLNRPVAELEIYHPGGEFDPSSPAGADLAARMPQIDAPELEAAGIVESKFGTVALLRPVASKESVKESVKDGADACLAFSKRIDDPALQISGWTCQGADWPARRAAIGCMLNRLTLLTAGHAPKLAELFARAELKRGSCTANPSDWVTGAETPRLRGTF